MTPVSPHSGPAAVQRRIPSSPHLGASLRTQTGGDVVSEPAVRRWRAFGLLVVAYFMTIVDLTIVNVALPTIGVKLYFPESDLQWVVTAYGLTFGGFLLLGGRAADLLGRRRLLMVGLAVFSAASLACGLATSDTFLIIMRGIQGLGAALVLPAALSIVMNMFPEGAERNKALGIWGATGAMGATVGLLAGGLLTRYLGWQYIFFLNVPIGAAALALAPKVVPESKVSTERRRYDPFGAASITSALVVFVYTISEAPQVGWGATRTVAMLAVAAALLGTFFVIETRVEAPLLPLRLFRLSSVAGSNAVGFLAHRQLLHTFIFIGTLYMQQVLGFSALKTGLAWLTTSVTTALAFAGPVPETGHVDLAQAGHGIRDGAYPEPAFCGPPGSQRTGTSGRNGRAVASWRASASPFAFIPVSIGALAAPVSTEGDARRWPPGSSARRSNSGGAIGVAVASSVAASRLHTLIHQGYGDTAARSPAAASPWPSGSAV